jgi:peptide/nickel transport system permease protein
MTVPKTAPVFVTKVEDQAATQAHGRAARFTANRRARFGLGLTALVVAIAVFGPLFAPHDPYALLGPVYGDPVPGHPLGFDHVGRDVLSRVLHGGVQLVCMSLAVALIAWVVGLLIGLVAGYSTRAVDQTIVWCADTFHAFPQVVLVLLVVSMLGRERWLIVLTAASAMVPGVIRLARGLTLAAASQDFVEAAAMMGQSRWRIRVREILPNILRPLLVHLGTMFSWGVTILAGLSFLGYGVAPPTPDWGLMVNENRAGLQVQPWGVVAPTLAIALLALGTNTLAESFGQSSGERRS